MGRRAWYCGAVRSEEGLKSSNPDSDITLMVKQMRKGGRNRSSTGEEGGEKQVINR